MTAVRSTPRLYDSGSATPPNSNRLLKNSKTVVLALLCATSMWLYFYRVMVPQQKSVANARQAPRGNLSDLYPRWVGARELLLNRQNPYSPEVTREIQRGYYGRELDPSRPGDPKDEQAFAYPVYVVFLLAPTVELPFRTVRIAFEVFLISITAASVWLWLAAFAWRPPTAVGLTAAILVLGSFAAVQGVKLDQLSLLVAGLIALCAALLGRGHLLAAGIVLALATIKPQLVAPLTACLLLWAVTRWTKRQRFVWGFGITLVALVVGGEFLLPGWITDFWNAMHDYIRYTGGESLLDLLLSPFWGPIATLVLFLGLALVVTHFRTAEAASQQFSYLLGAVLAGTLIVVPMVAPYNHLILVPAVLLIVRNWDSLWRANAVVKGLCVATIIALGWQWVFTVALSMASFWLEPATVQAAWTLPLEPTHIIPFVILLQMTALVCQAWSTNT